jgi:hypothetical protein
MIKREYIQRYRFLPTRDEQGGSTFEREPHEEVRAHISVGATMSQLTQFGEQKQEMLNVVTDIKLDEYVWTRYFYNNRFFKLMRQVKQGNEWFSVLLEVNE